MKRFNYLLTILIILTVNAFAETKTNLTLTNPPQSTNSVEARVEQEKLQNNSLFLISTYKPNYILPFYYNTAVTDPSSGDSTGNRNPKHEEIKFQVSFKFPIWHVTKVSTLYAAYSQLSFWQAYTNSPYFRETNYEPELFLTNNINIPIGSNWKLNFLNVGANHQSNGRGGDLERSWNRVYLEAIFANDDWMFSIKPWYISHDSSLTHNPDIAGYLGHERIVTAYKYNKHVFSFEKTNIEKGFSRGSIQLTWSFPVTQKIKGYIQYFNGYGQSLIEYNHYTSSAGIGIALNDWI